MPDMAVNYKFFKPHNLNRDSLKLLFELDHEEVLPLLGGRGEFGVYMAYSGSNDVLRAKYTQISLIIVLIFGKPCKIIRN